MILSALLSITAPLSIPQYGQDYVLRDTEDLSSDVITIRRFTLLDLLQHLERAERDLDALNLSL